MNNISSIVCIYIYKYCFLFSKHEHLIIYLWEIIMNDRLTIAPADIYEKEKIYKYEMKKIINIKK